MNRRGDTGTQTTLGYAVENGLDKAGHNQSFSIWP